MKKGYFYVMSLLIAALAVTVGCGNSESTDEDTDTTPVSKGDGGDDDFVPITAKCDPEKTCSALEHPEDCIADFQLGTLQAGNAEAGTYEQYVGFYGFLDYTEHPIKELIPSPNQRASEDAWAMNGCDPESNDNGNYVLRMSGEGYTNWGAGMGMDWGNDGKLNPDCNYEDDDSTLSDDNKCLEIVEANTNVLIEDLEADEACQDENGDPDPRKIRCALYRRTIKMPRDLSAYKGIGMWVMRVDPDSENQVNVKFGVPQTTRWFGSTDIKEAYRLEEYTYGDDYCTDETGDKTLQCYNDYAYLMELPEANRTWEYREVLFEDLAISPQWGLQLDNPDKFPATQSIGIKFQFDMTPGVYFDFYLDDIFLIRK